MNRSLTTSFSNDIEALRMMRNIFTLFCWVLGTLKSYLERIWNCFVVVVFFGKRKLTKIWHTFANRWSLCKFSDNEKKSFRIKFSSIKRMNYFKFICAALILGTAVALPESDKTIPSFKFDDLLNDLNGLSQERNVLKQVAETSKNLGAFLITDIPQNDDYLKALKDLEKDAESCFNEKSEKIVSLKVSPSVVRSTSAVSSIDPSSVHPACIRSSADVIGEAMNKVGTVVHQVTQFFLIKFKTLTLKPQKQK